MKTTGDSLSTVGSALATSAVNHLWQSSVVGAVILGLLYVAPNLSARTRRTLAWLALAKFALPIMPVISTLCVLWGTGSGGIQPSSPSVSATPSVGTWIMPVPATLADSFWVRECLGVAGCIWAAGVVVLCGVWVVGGRRFRRQLLAGAEALTPSQRQLWLAAAERTGFQPPPRCLSVDPAYGPGVLGIVSPIVILPRGIETSLSAEELGAILVHELVHVRRRDHLWNLLQVFLVGTFWFDPVIWLLHRHLNAEVERSCDEEVLAITADPRITRAAS